MLLDRALLSLKLRLKKESTFFNKFRFTLDINELLYPYAETPDLFNTKIIFLAFLFFGQYIFSALFYAII